MMEYLQLAPEIAVITNFLSADECRQYITESEKRGYTDAPVTTRFGPRMMKDVRNNMRVMYADKKMAADLYKRARPLLPETVNDFTICGLNEMFRYYRYAPGQSFNTHRDGAFERSVTEKSYYTFMIYLNEDFTGGETTFENLSVKPQTGTALLFRHHLLHTGTTVTTGLKYVLRTDVMYRYNGE